MHEDGTVISHRGNQLKLQRGTNGYLHFSTGTEDLGYGTVEVHRLAAFQWFGEAALNSNIEVRHRDNQKLNNAKSNLLLGSRSDNALDLPAETRQRHARHAAHKQRKLTPDQARAIQQETKLSNRALAKRFNVSPSTIRNARKRIHYRDA